MFQAFNSYECFRDAFIAMTGQNNYTPTLTESQFFAELAKPLENLYSFSFCIGQDISYNEE